MRKVKKKVVIVSPRQESGGAIVLHLLCKLLNEKGIDAKVLVTHVYNEEKYNVIFFIKWLRWFVKDSFKSIIRKISKGKYFKINEPVKRYRRKYLPFINKKNTIVIYPEVCYGNVLKAKNVVRYLLYYNKFSDDIKAYDESDLFICYREQFNDWEKNPKGFQFRFRAFNKDLYKQTNFGEREGSCYLFYKGKNRKDLPTQIDGPLLDELDENEKVKILNEKKYCYVYDTQTFYNRIIAVCGCIPIVIMEKGKCVKDYKKGSDNCNGVAWGNTKEEIERAINTRQLLLDEINEFEYENDIAIMKFINLLKERFGEV